MHNVTTFYADSYLFAIYDRHETLVGVCDNKWELDKFFKKDIQFSRMSKSVAKDRVMLIDNFIVYHIPVYEITKDVFESEDLVFAEMFRKPTKKERLYNNYVRNEKTKFLNERERER